MSTAKWFMVIALVFIIIFVILTWGKNPFAFSDAYFRPRTTPSSNNPKASVTVLPADASPTNLIIQDVEVGDGINIDR